MAKQKRRKPKPQQRSAEPTVAQQREEWRKGKAEDEALEELGLMLDLEGREPPKYDVIAGADARDQIDRLELLLAYYRWTVLTGTTPLPEDWEASEDWPHPDAAEALFGSWDGLVDSSRIEDGLLIELVERLVLGLGLAPLLALLRDGRLGRPLLGLGLAALLPRHREGG